MRRSEMIEGLQMLNGKIHERYDAGELGQIEAAGLLGVSERTFRRWCGRFQDGGEGALSDRRLGRAAHNRAHEAQADKIEFVSGEVFRLYGEAFSRAPDAGRVLVGLHVDQIFAAAA